MQSEINFNVHVNSVNTYKEKIIPTLMGRKLEVLNAVKELGGEATLYEIGALLNKPLNTFSGRIKELRLMNLLEDTGRFKIHHDNKFTIWKSL